MAFRLAALFLLLSLALHSQTTAYSFTRAPIQMVNINSINSITVLDCGSVVGVVDNRSTVSRTNDYNSFVVASASGSWSAALNYSDSSCTGPWVSFGSNSLVTNGSATPWIGFGQGYHPFLQFVITGNATINYAATRSMNYPQSSGAGGGFSWQGVWSNATAYLVNAVVSYNGSTYICITANTNQTPASSPTYWQLFVPGGVTGPASGDLCNNYPNPTVCGINNTNVTSLTGILKLTAGVPSAAVGDADYQNPVTLTTTGTTGPSTFAGDVLNIPNYTTSLPGTGAQRQYLQVKPNSGNTTTYQWSSFPWVYAQDFNFAAISPSGTISAGSSTVTLPIVPQGMNGSDPYSSGTQGHYVYVGGSGTPEACPITGGGGTAGQTNGQIIILCANSHGAGYTISSATGGAGEAAQYLATTYGYGAIVLPPGPTVFYGPLYLQQPLISNAVGSGGIGYRYRLTGQGASVSQIRLAASAAQSGPDAVGFPLSATGAIAASYGPQSYTTYGPEIDNLSVYAIEPDTSSLGSYTQWPPLIYAYSAPKTLVHDVQLFGWNGASFAITGRSRMSNVILTTFGTGISSDAQADSMYFDKVQFYPLGTTTAQTNVFGTCGDTSVTGFKFGRNDDTWISNSFFYIPTAISQSYSGAYPSLNGLPEINVLGTNFDTCSVVSVADGTLSIGGKSGISTGTSGSWGTVTGGNLYIDGGGISGSPSTGPFINALFTAPSTLTGNSISITNVPAISFATSNDEPIIAFNDSGGSVQAMMTVTGNLFFRNPSYAFTTPMIDDQSSNPATQVTVNSNWANDRASNADTFVHVHHDGPKVVKVNTLDQAAVQLDFSCPCNGEYESATVRFGFPIDNMPYAPSAVASGGTIAIPQYAPPAGGHTYYYRQITISGTSAISTLTVPSGVTGMHLDVLASAAWSTSTSGNFAQAITAVAGNKYSFDLVNGLWYVTGAVAGASGSLPVTNNALRGDGTGNAIAVTGTGTNCVLVNGTSTSSCGASGAQLNVANTWTAQQTFGTSPAIFNPGNVSLLNTPADTVFQGIGANSLSTAGAYLDLFTGNGAYFPRFHGRIATGSAASPTANAAGEYMAEFGGQAYDGSAEALGGSMKIQVLSTWTNANHDTRILWQIAPHGSTTLTSLFWGQNNGGRGAELVPASDGFYLGDRTGPASNGSTPLRWNIDALTVNADTAVNLEAGANMQCTHGASNATCGTAVLNGTTGVTVSTTAIAALATTGAGSAVRLYYQGGSGANTGQLYVSAVSAGTSFTIKSTNASDANTVYWIIDTIN